MKRFVLLLLVVTLGIPAGASPSASRAPVLKIRVTGFGPVLARSDRQALYYWNAEKRAGFKVKCTGACAKLWPPLLVRSAAGVPTRVAGIKGTFGAVRRPDGTLQLTYNRLPVYTYVHEGPGIVRCDNVGGWFVVRL